ncbi:penicillin-binding protein [Arcicella sp. DC2W]|uniref:Penicillin-binding protein n=1 Tax=Arcicella gelida TaxID=2984195 RepID=A0ABU5SBT1_9BACT|nr:penicillin-binding protein [Arcicella sp. DC2W]MEA5405951.1 penicillin-binding protein [Arcicella sp. DC2W]
MNIKKDIVMRLRFVFLLILCFAGGIIWRIVQLQNIEGEKWRKASSLRYVSERTIEAVRGNIYADDGSLLATSLPKYRLGFDPLVSLSDKNKAIFEDGIEELCKKLSNFYGDKDWKDYYSMISLARHEKDRYMLLNNSLIDFQDVKMMKKWPIFKEGKYKGGVVFEKVNVRYNPFGKMGFRTIGYKKDKEKVGIENSFDAQLAGVPGKGIFEKIGQGSFRPIDGGEEAIPIPGLDIHTTINVNIQDVAESSLLRALKRSGADKGCVVVMEVATGEIKAMTNLTRMRDTSNYAETYNHAVLGLTDPGSVFKLASMVALMEEWNLSNTEMVNTENGEMKIGDKILKDAKIGGYGNITAQSVFEHSSNVGTAKLMLKYFGKGNEKKYYKKLHDFHLDQRLNFQLRPDAVPRISPPKKGDITGLPWNSIGYGMSLTPLQMLTFYNAIANDGKWIQPIIVKETRVADRVEDDFKLKQEVDENPICSAETLKKVRKMLEGVVERGTASNIKNDLYKIAGKTGTSQKLINGKYRKGMYYTSFIGYFPADAPKYSCVVAIDNPRGVKREALFASDASAPVFKEIADKIYACDIQMHKLLAKNDNVGVKLTSQKQIVHTSDIKAINEELGIERKPVNEGWAVMEAENGRVQYKEHSNPKNKVPDLRGMSLRDAIYILENKGFKVSYSGFGKVQSQSIPPGVFAAKNRTIGLVLN